MAVKSYLSGTEAHTAFGTNPLLPATPMEEILRCVRVQLPKAISEQPEKTVLFEKQYLTIRRIQIKSAIVEIATAISPGEIATKSVHFI